MLFSSAHVLPIRWWPQRLTLSAPIITEKGGRWDTLGSHLGDRHSCSTLSLLLSNTTSIHPRKDSQTPRLTEQLFGCLPRVSTDTQIHNVYYIPLWCSSDNHSFPAMSQSATCYQILQHYMLPTCINLLKTKTDQIRLLILKDQVWKEKQNRKHLELLPPNAILNAKQELELNQRLAVLGKFNSTVFVIIALYSEQIASLVPFLLLIPFPHFTSIPPPSCATRDEQTWLIKTGEKLIHTVKQLGQC